MDPTPARWPPSGQLWISVRGLVTGAVARRPNDAQIVRAQPRHVPEQVCRQPGMLGKPSREWRSQAAAAQLHAAAGEQGPDLTLGNPADVTSPRGFQARSEEHTSELQSLA